MEYEEDLLRLKDRLEVALDYARDAGISFDRIEEEWRYLFQCAMEDDG